MGRCLAHRPEVDALDEPQHVDRAEDDAGRRDDRERDALRDLLAEHRPAPHRSHEGAEEDEELADETVRAREPDRGERDDDEDRRQRRSHLGEASVGREVAGVGSLVQVSDEEEERSGRDAVIHHL